MAACLKMFHRILILRIIPFHVSSWIIFWWGWLNPDSFFERVYLKETGEFPRSAHWPQILINLLALLVTDLLDFVTVLKTSRQVHEAIGILRTSLRHRSARLPQHSEQMSDICQQNNPNTVEPICFLNFKSILNFYDKQMKLTTFVLVMESGAIRQRQGTMVESFVSLSVYFQLITD